MIQGVVLVYIWISSVMGAFPSSNDSNSVFQYETGSIRGVALGGWLVLEPYITPSLFYQAGNLSGEVPLDEYHFADVLQSHNSTELLRDHWDTFIVESDFTQISDWGFNLVRIPIGYWAFALKDDDPYITGQKPYLDRAIGWASQHNLKVWIDLHGVPGSQNGFDNSGLRDHIDWQESEENINITTSVLSQIFEEYSNNTDTVIGFEIVNEPLAANLSTPELRDFYSQSYRSLRQHTYNNIVLHDAFKPLGYWDSFLYRNYTNITYENIVIDHHHYEVFDTNQLNSSIRQHIQAIVDYSDGVTEERHPAVVGEWSAALTDCTYWLNGVDRGARFDGTFRNNITIGECDNIQDYLNWSPEFRNDTRRFIELQIQSYGLSSGWIFWTYKTEDTIDWDLQRLIQYDLFPQPLDNFTYNLTEYLDESVTSAGSVDISSGSSLSPNWMLIMIMTVFCIF